MEFSRCFRRANTSHFPFQGGDLSLPLTSLKECALHVAIYQENGTSLPLVDFLVQNSHSLDRQTVEGNTPLHYCVISNKPECMRLLLRVGANPSIENNNGKTPLDIANERNCRLLEDMVSAYSLCLIALAFLLNVFREFYHHSSGINLCVFILLIDFECS